VGGAGRTGGAGDWLAGAAVVGTLAGDGASADCKRNKPTRPAPQASQRSGALGRRSVAPQSRQTNVFNSGGGFNFNVGWALPTISVNVSSVDGGRCPPLQNYKTSGP
jgi:hypothetical protein